MVNDSELQGGCQAISQGRLQAATSLHDMLFLSVNFGLYVPPAYKCWKLLIDSDAALTLRLGTLHAV